MVYGRRMDLTIKGIDYNWEEMPLQHQTYTVVDVETTGVSESDAVVEFAMVRFDRGRVRERFSALVDPGVAIPATASAVHLLRDAHVAGRPTLADYTDDIVEFTSPWPIVAHNAEFDRGFLPMIAHLPHICTLRLARHLLPDAPSYKNSVLRYLLKLDDAYDLSYAMIPHRAEADAIVTGYLLQKLLSMMHNRTWTLQGVAQIAASRINVTHFGFGKYRGRLIAEIAKCDRGYLEWIVNQALSSKEGRFEVDSDTLDAVMLELGRPLFSATAA